jgi:hypothetical protein
MTRVLEVVQVDFDVLSDRILKTRAHRFLAIHTAYFVFFPHFQPSLVAFTVQPPTTLYETLWGLFNELFSDGIFMAVEGH